jgi:undecaprenyl-diphosphatase
VDPPRWLQTLDGLDRSLYRAVASSPTSGIDEAMARLSTAADYWRLWLVFAAALALTRGERGKDAAKLGLASLAATATVVNVALKPLTRRRRPDREAHQIPDARRVRMPRSRSFPSGHTAQAFAFADGVGRVLPREGAALRFLAVAVGYSRVHTGVHYPSDVILGALIGKLMTRVVRMRLEPIR